MSINKIKRDKHGRIADSLTVIRACGVHSRRVHNESSEISYSGARHKLQGWNKWSKG